MDPDPLHPEVHDQVLLPELSRQLRDVSSKHNGLGISICVIITYIVQIIVLLLLAQSVRVFLCTCVLPPTPTDCMAG